MGKEWYWGGKSSKKGRGVVSKQSSSAAAGCMNAVFHLFDFHQFHFGIPQQEVPSANFAPSSIPEELTPPKGTEAPRNSLELDQPPSLSSHQKRHYEDLNLPMGIQIRTSLDQRPIYDPSQELGSSDAGNRTPTLVARLMGLDILPVSCLSSPRVSSTLEVTPPYADRKPSPSYNHNCHNHSLTRMSRTQQRGPRRSCGLDTEAMNCGGTRSLPETPRISSARRSMDAIDHRLSLQINKENSSSGDEFDLSRFRSFIRRKEAKNRELEGNRSPSDSARNLVKQGRDTVSRTVGVDITNTAKNRESDSRERDILVNHCKSKQESFSSSSSKIRFVQNTNNQSCYFIVDIPKLQPLEEEVQGKRPRPKRNERCKNPAIFVDEKFDAGLKKPTRTWNPANRSKQGEVAFVRRPPSSSSSTRGNNNPEKKCNKKTHPLPAKKDPSPPATKIPQKQQAHDAACTSRQKCPTSQSSERSGLQEAKHRLREHDRPKDGGDWPVESLQYYLTRVLKRCNVFESDMSSSSFISFGWSSASHPLDPSIFHLLELNPDVVDHMRGQLRHKCNRRLLFDLFDETLGDVWSEPARYLTRNDWSKGWAQVITWRLCNKIRSFPQPDCQYLEDIDGLIEGDMASWKGYEEEGAGLVSDIEEDIMDKLIRETAMACGVFGMFT